MQNGSIRLRAMEPEDLELLYHIENDYEIWGVGITNVPYSRYVLKEFVAAQTGDIFTDKQVRLMVEDMSGEVVGIVDLVNFDPAHRRAELGVLIRKAYRRKGYAMDAVKAVCRYAKEIVHLHQIYIVIATDNRPAIELFQKVGFKKTAELTDWLCDGSAYHPAILMQYIITQPSDFIYA